MNELRYLPTPAFAATMDEGRSQRWLARKVGVDDTLLSKARHGERTLSFAVALRVSELLGVPFSVLFVPAVSVKTNQSDVKAEAVA